MKVASAFLGGLLLSCAPQGPAAAVVPVAAPTPPVDEVRDGRELETVRTVRGGGDKVDVFGPVRPENASRVHVGMRASFRVPELAGVSFEGKLSTLDQAGVHVLFQNFDRRLKDGMGGKLLVDLASEPSVEEPH